MPVVVNSPFYAAPPNGRIVHVDTGHRCGLCKTEVTEGMIAYYPEGHDETHVFCRVCIAGYVKAPGYRIQCGHCAQKVLRSAYVKRIAVGIRLKDIVINVDGSSVKEEDDEAIESKDPVMKQIEEDEAMARVLQMEYDGQLTDDDEMSELTETTTSREVFD